MLLYTKMNITASILYDYIQCSHRVWRDKYGPQDEKIKETNPFVQLLWDKGIQHEERIIKDIGEFTDLRQGTFDERANATTVAMQNGTPLIYQGVLKYKSLIGIPDLLKRLPSNNYIPVEIKSGRGLEASAGDWSEGKLKKHYAVQLCLYVEILKQHGFAKENKGVVVDIFRNEVEYLLDSPMGKINNSSWWQFYERIKEEVGCLLSNAKQNKPAFGGVCKLCPWFTSCKKWCQSTSDLTNIFYLGRSKRDVLNSDLGVEKVEELSRVNVENILKQKKHDKNFLQGVAKNTLIKLSKRAEIIANTKKPVLYEKVDFPNTDYELFFDIETDPTQDFVYLHGVWERTLKGERFIYFLADNVTPEAEKKAWMEFWEYIDNLPLNNFSVYYYSPYEKTIYRQMAALYPDVKTVDQVKEFFENSNIIDLYSDIVFKKTDWPLASYSIKDIAGYLGFKWRDESPSGALSIQWFDEYIKTKNPDILKRIVEYNEDDCKATLVLKDKLVELNSSL